MAQKTSRANGASPLESAVQSLGKVRKQLRARTREIEKRFEKGRRQIGTRGRRQVESLLAEVRKNPVVQRAQTLRKDAERRLETGVENVLSVLQIASKSDVEKIDRKIRTLSKKLAELEKDEGSSAHA